MPMFRLTLVVDLDGPIIRDDVTDYLLDCVQHLKGDPDDTHRPTSVRLYESSDLI